ncbi:tripartite tricarboxylate transporter substrate-binding protein [Bacillus velezensis]|uniref:tripartite tricarboxylate transporter substrate binding protein n=1 Tax=Bacillus TaxID=1386 RepID=UPI0011B59723|nr:MULTISPECIES: tripartite tricarboxylate transporter substrate-binding protein [Bacillus amyloliquefaciens group]MEC3631278.1 tripartite tricarboxylate transporter substrate-binding protein [Bacillus velezensis]NRR27587.1 tripartite tricarboxylate transporter substrate binding protein [Bacillus velezensis]QGJ63984.1 tripartite tricarboxylate transporter substrate binding protein [Bacillus velezensis]
MKRLGVLLVMLAALVSFDGRQMEGFRSAEGPIEIVVPAAPQGGWDVTAKALQSVIERKQILGRPVKIIYKPGGGGDSGWKYVNERKTDVISMNSSLLLSNEILGQSRLKAADFTPLAIIAKEWQTVALPKDSKIKSGKRLLGDIKANPGGIKIGFAPGLGNDDQLSFARAAEMAGISPFDIRFFQYGSSNEVIEALISHEIDAASMTISEARDAYRKGKITLAAVTSDKRLSGFSDVPTWKEQGVPFVFAHWRGIMGPKDMTEGEIAYWDQALKQITSSAEWKQMLKKRDWESFYKNSSGAKRFLEEQTEFYKEMMSSEK